MSKAHTPEHREKIRQALLARGRGTQDKLCRGCKTTKPRSDFGARPNGFSRSQCKACEVRNWKAWQAANPDKVKALNWQTNLRRWYGLTPEQYGQMLAAQGGQCAICKCSPDESTHGRLFVDHSAETGRIRGLLCGNCNSGIGYLRHDRSRLNAAIAYLDAPPVK